MQTELQFSHPRCSIPSSALAFLSIHKFVTSTNTSTCWYIYAYTCIHVCLHEHVYTHAFNPPTPMPSPKERHCGRTTASTSWLGRLEKSHPYSHDHTWSLHGSVFLLPTLLTPQRTCFLGKIPQPCKPKNPSSGLAAKESESLW